MDNTVKKMKKKMMKSEALAVHVDRRLLGENKARAPEVLAVRGRGAPSRRSNTVFFSRPPATCFKLA